MPDATSNTKLRLSEGRILSVMPARYLSIFRLPAFELVVMLCLGIALMPRVAMSAEESALDPWVVPRAPQSQPVKGAINLDEVSDVNARDAWGHTPLMSAARSGNLERMKWLLDHGADVNAKDDRYGMNAFMWACNSSRGKLEMVLRLLIEKGADCNSTDHSGNPVLVWAATRSCVETVKGCLSRGANVKYRDRHGWTPLIWVATGWQPSLEVICRNKGLGPCQVIPVSSLRDPVGGVLKAEIAKLLLEHGADASARDGNGCTALIWAAAWGNVELLRILLGAGAPVNAKNRDGTTALMAAATKGWVIQPISWGEESWEFPSRESRWRQCLNALLDNGADTNATNNKGETALMAAVEHDNAVGAVALLKRGANINARDNNGKTTLMRAVKMSGFAEVYVEGILPWPRVTALEYLLDKGADPNSKDNEGHTALMVAVYKCNARRGPCSIKGGADVAATDVRGLTAKDQISSSHCPDREKAELREALIGPGTR